MLEYFQSYEDWSVGDLWMRLYLGPGEISPFLAEYMLDKRFHVDEFNVPMLETVQDDVRDRGVNDLGSALQLRLTYAPSIL